MSIRSLGVIIVCIVGLMVSNIFAKGLNVGDVNEPAALKMLDTYRNLDSYQARWELQMPGYPNDPNVKIFLETAYERKTGQCLYKMQACKRLKAKWVPVALSDSMGTLLVTYNKPTLKAAIQTMGGESEIQEKAYSDPNEFNYRQFRKATFPFYPFDLPLLFSETPFHEMLQSDPESAKEITEVPEDPNAMPRKGIEIYSEFGETTVRVFVDSDLPLINEFCYFDEGSRQVNPSFPKFIRTELITNKPLQPDLFNFEKQYSTFPRKDQTVNKN